MSDTTPNHQAADRPRTLTAAMNALLRTYPGPDATLAQRIAWFDNKAAVLDRIAADEFCESPAEAAELAANARRMAATLREQEAGR
jgi:hypothetical protein